MHLTTRGHVAFEASHLILSMCRICGASLLISLCACSMLCDASDRASRGISSVTEEIWVLILSKNVLLPVTRTHTHTRDLFLKMSLSSPQNSLWVQMQNAYLQLHQQFLETLWRGCFCRSSPPGDATNRHSEWGQANAQNHNIVLLFLRVIYGKLSTPV